MIAFTLNCSFFLCVFRSNSVNLLQDILGRWKVLYWKLRLEISLAHIEGFGSTQLVNDKVYVFQGVPGILLTISLSSLP